MNLEARLAAMEERLKALEKENRELKGIPSFDQQVAKSPEEIRRKIAEVPPLKLMEIKAFARDVTRYGYDQAAIMHGRALPKRGRRRAV